MVCPFFIIFIILTTALTSLLILQIYLKLTTGWCRSNTCLVGKTAIITGANRGIGYAAALDFAKRGAKVILACRNRKLAEDAKKHIITQTGNQNIVVKIVDLSSFASVRAFAKDINTSEERLDILVNNAGVAFTDDQKTEDGCLHAMQVNYFSLFLLTNLLIGLMKKSQPSRIVNVSSLLAKYAWNFDVNSLNKFQGNRHTYRASKLSIILFTMELARKLAGTQVTTYSVHPGLVDTDIFRNMGGFAKLIISFANRFSKTSEEGAQTILHCAVTKGIEPFSGEHFSDCERVETYKTAAVPELSEKLWKVTEKITQLKPEESQFEH